MSKKKELDIGSIVEIYTVTNGLQINCEYSLGVVLSKTISGNTYRVKDFNTLRENWYESKDLKDVTEIYPNLLTNCCLKYKERGTEFYYKITGVKIEEGNIFVLCAYGDHFWHNIKYLEGERFTLV